MRICIICEGCYPYVPGGVSSWIQMSCNHFSDVEFVIWAIATNRKEMSEYKYKVPDNVKDISTIYLGEEQFSHKYKKIYLSIDEKETLKNLVVGVVNEIDWEKTLKFMKKHKRYLTDILMSEDFYEICLEEYERQQSKKVFQHFLWNIRGMYFPLMHILSDDIPKADIYHCVSTGYAGILGSCASYIRKKPLLISEHGIYTREREEDIIRSNWVEGDFKELWIEFFKKLSYIAYNQATNVTSLFEINKMLQIELGCPEKKICIIPNGINPEEFLNLKSYNKLNSNKFNIAAVLRVVPIKDVKTMILAFDIVREKMPEVKLSIMGNQEENPEYYEECRKMIEDLKIDDVEFLGQVNVKEYFPEIDLLLLSSISEGQPLAILEGMAAGIPIVSTNVGDCKGLLEGEDGDNLGRAGIITPVMNSEAMAEAIIYCIKHPNERKRMGLVGQRRVDTYYRKDVFLKEYSKMYEKLGGDISGRYRI